VFEFLQSLVMAIRSHHSLTLFILLSFLNIPSEIIYGNIFEKYASLLKLFLYNVEITIWRRCDIFILLLFRRR
jgi:hypothetical protein